MSTYLNSKLNLQVVCSTLPSAMAQRPDLPEFDKAKVGERIVVLRAAKNGLPQKALAEAIGITAQKLSNYESGRDLIPVPTAARLCAVTGADFEYLYRGNMGNLPTDLLKRIMEAHAAHLDSPPRRARRP